jgi:hypothetical protein
LVEEKYIDRDYLEDYAEYYVRCFKRYKAHCTRLHFFDKEISKEQFETVLKGGDIDWLQEAYLGFVVVKPLPQTIIGRTCLRTYPSDSNRRFYPSTRSYEANLFGIKLKAPKTLAFQEQDRVAAACATSALWSVFQGTGKLFQHPIPSPVVITRAATKFLPLETRTLPNTGLTPTQMAYAIREVGLEPFTINAGTPHVLKGNLYAYLKARIPLLLIADLYDTSTGGPEFFDKHAIAVTGYSLGLKNPIPHGPTGFMLRASRIDKIYAHDDQVGPFARMSFTELTIKLKQKRKGKKNAGLKFDFLSTSWCSPIDGRSDVFARPENLLVPLYHKIRIPFNSIQAIVISFDAFVEFLRTRSLIPLEDRLEWDVYLTTINDFKSEIRECTELATSERLSVQLQPMPRFLWIAEGYCKEKREIALVFDATDIEQGSFFVRAVDYNPAISQFFKALGSDLDNLKGLVQQYVIDILRWYTGELDKKTD